MIVTEEPEGKDLAHPDGEPAEDQKTRCQHQIISETRVEPAENPTLVPPDGIVDPQSQDEIFLDCRDLPLDVHVDSDAGEVQALTPLNELPYRLPNYISGQNHLYDFVSEHLHRFQELATNVHPLVHPKALKFFDMFLTTISCEGNLHERKLYQPMSIDEFVIRLLTRRPLAFYLQEDKYLLKDGTEGRGGFEMIGKPEERHPLILSEFLSYDEMILSALVSVSAPTFFFQQG